MEHFPPIGEQIINSYIKEEKWFIFISNYYKYFGQHSIYFIQPIKFVKNDIDCYLVGMSTKTGNIFDFKPKTIHFLTFFESAYEINMAMPQLQLQEMFFEKVKRLKLKTQLKS